MRTVEHMEQHPPVCLHCGKGNTPDTGDGDEMLPYLDLQRDVNWGDSTYLCGACCMLIAGLYDFIGPSQYKDLERTIESRDAVIHELRAKLAAKTRRLTAIVEGKKAISEERASRVA